MSEAGTELVPHGTHVDGVEFGSTGLVLADDLTEGNWREALRAASEFEHRALGAAAAATWWIGDLLAFGERRYGETYRVATELTGRTYDSLRRMSSVSRRVPPERRVAGLSWRTHRLVAPFEPGSQELWLGRASENGWDSMDLDSALRAQRPGPPAEFPDAEAGLGLSTCATEGPLIAGDGTGETLPERDGVELVSGEVLLPPGERFRVEINSEAAGILPLEHGHVYELAGEELRDQFGTLLGWLRRLA